MPQTQIFNSLHLCNLMVQIPLISSKLDYFILGLQRNTHGFNRSVNIPESCDFQSQFEILKGTVWEN